jgi:hypothetical protein
MSTLAQTTQVQTSKQAVPVGRVGPATTLVLANLRRYVGATSLRLDHAPTREAKNLDVARPLSVSVEGAGQRACTVPTSTTTLSAQYSMLTDTCQVGILPPWARKRKTRRCGLPKLIWLPLRLSVNVTDVSPIRRRCGWLWHGFLMVRGAPLPPHSRRNGTLIPSPKGRRDFPCRFVNRCWQCDNHQLDYQWPLSPAPTS